MGITGKELAQILNLSGAAVSMALNNKPGVSTETRKKVIEVAKQYNYDFSSINVPIESTLTKGTLYFVIYKKHGAVVTDTPFFSQLSQGIDSGCKKSGYHLNIYYLYEENNVSEQLNEIIRMGCKGILLLGTEMGKTDILPLINLSIPIVILDTYFEGINRDFVLINNIGGAYNATNHLIAKRKSQPGYLHSSYEINNFKERATGFFNAVRDNGMSKRNSIIHLLSPSMEGAYADMIEIIEQGEELADSYFADNDLIAAGAIKAFKEKGYMVPKDISVIGFDNMPLCLYIEPTLSTVNVPKQYMGEIAVERLANLINKRETFPIKIEILGNLVLRKSE